MMRFLLYLLVIYAFWQIIKFVFKVALHYWIRKNAGKTFHYTGQFGGRNGSDEQRPVGDIRVENPGAGRQKNQNRDDMGEYIDFEEVS